MTVSLSKTKFEWISKSFFTIIIILFLLTSIAPIVTTIHPKIPPQQDINALGWLKDNSDPNSTVLGRIEEGHLISKIAERKNVADMNFLLIKNVDQIYDDIDKAYSTHWKSEAVRIMNQYDVNYILLSEASKKEYNITELFYAEPDCFDKIYEHYATIYKFLGCKIE